MLKNIKIGVFVMKSIAAYKVPELVRQLIKKGAQVQVAMTQSAQEFVTPLTLQVLTKRQVLTHTFDEWESSQVQHVGLGACVGARGRPSILSGSVCCGMGRRSHHNAAPAPHATAAVKIAPVCVMTSSARNASKTSASSSPRKRGRPAC